MNLVWAGLGRVVSGPFCRPGRAATHPTRVSWRVEVTLWRTTSEYLLTFSHKLSRTIRKGSSLLLT